MEKYLRKYAEPVTRAAADITPGEPWRQALVVPVCNESTGILRPLPPAAGRSLVILVVNETEAAPRNVSTANRRFAAAVRERFTQCWRSNAGLGLTLYRDPASPRDVLLVDRFTSGYRFPPGGGVGHARKTGADLAACLVYQQRVRSPWIHCSDADVRLPQRYFTCTRTLEDNAAQATAALVYPFRHTNNPGSADPEIMQATWLYEYSLRYYVAGLSYAGSPYAFHTIGSTLAVNADHYARVRGFPRRQAGEDFYLLNKLAKVGFVRQLSADKDCEPIEIAARLSDRVPFGTGAAVGKIVKLEDPAGDFLLYHPFVFELLREWLASLPAFWKSRTCDLDAVLTTQGLRPLREALEAAGVARALQHALRQSSTCAQFQRQMHTWFDAFRTLKLIHYLRDHYLPSVGYRELARECNTGHLDSHEPALRGMRNSEFFL